MLLVAIATLTQSCKKDWLDIRSNKALVVPTTIDDLQAVVDNTVELNKAPAVGEISADNYYLTYQRWQALTAQDQQRAYIWAKDDVYGSATVTDWYYPYKSVLYANIALEGAEKIVPSDKERSNWNNLKGSALFFRSFAFYHLIQIYCNQYDPSTAETDLGIPLRLQSDIEQITQRSTLKASYEKVISDLNEAAALLPDVPSVRTRPSKASAFGLLSRVYLSMGNYTEALKAVDRSLGYYGTLINYNTLNPATAFPFTRLNSEVIFDAFILSSTILRETNAIIDPALYDSYVADDLRKQLFFNTAATGTINFGGSYTGASTADGFLFGGIATDELYLTRAECYARTGNTDLAMADLNLLLRNRYKQGTFVDLSAAGELEALTLILTERRKELLFRGLRFIDLKRLNKDPRFAITLRRELNNQVYELPPNDLRYTLPIPYSIVSGSGLTQNPR